MTQNKNKSLTLPGNKIPKSFHYETEKELGILQINESKKTKVIKYYSTMK